MKTFKKEVNLDFCGMCVHNTYSYVFNQQISHSEYVL